MKILPPATQPPRQPTIRRHEPKPAQGEEGYQAYRPCLRWEFGFTCAFIAWGDHFYRSGGRLLPFQGDVHASYTHQVYDLDDPRKVEMRRLRRELITNRLELFHRFPEDLNWLLSETEASPPRRAVLFALEELARFPPFRQMPRASAGAAGQIIIRCHAELIFRRSSWTRSFLIPPEQFDVLG
jgi:hypothetical protein